MTVAPREGRRRALHVASGLVGLAALRLPGGTTTTLLFLLLIVALLLELARRRLPPVAAALATLAGPLFRPAEARRLTGATLLAAGYAAAWLLAPGRPAAAGVLVTAVADPAAAWAGGFAAAPGAGKTWTGSAVALGAALLVLLLLGLSWPAALAGSAVAAAAERLGANGTDNLTMPVATAVTLRLLA